MTQSISVSVADLLISHLLSVYLMATGFVFYIED